MTDERRKKFFKSWDDDKGYIADIQMIEFYTNLSMSEHDIALSAIFEKCEDMGWKLCYYKKFDPHIPCFRRVGIMGTAAEIEAFNEWLQQCDDVNSGLCENPLEEKI